MYTIECEHDYKILVERVNANELRTDDTTWSVEVNGYALFYCSKCLNIQKKVIA